jgi:glycosyltransferase involved in cell wall biosynthesis
MEEEQRTGMQLVKPSRWMIAREKREYELAAHIRVLSTFARQSFILEGVSADKVALIPSAVPVNNFHVDQKIVAERCKRILAKRPIRILYVGTLCFRKGLYDLAAIIQKLHGEHFEFRLVGPALREAFPLLEAMQSYAKIDRKLPQAQLPSIYSWADLFIFPTLEDGYPAVLAQAYASALPILTTTNCSGPDLIKTGETGWVLPIRSPEAFVDRLIWCDSHRDELADMVCKVYADSHARKWSDVVCDIERFYQQRQTAAK